MKRSTWQTGIPHNSSYLKPSLPSGSARDHSLLSSGLALLSKGFRPISLKEMDSVALLNRIDTKFVMTLEQLQYALFALRQDYRILTIGSQRLNHYRNLYFDTLDFDLYHSHINGRAERYKVRSREYADSNLSFLEVKHKTRKDRTIKNRLSTSSPVLQINAEANTWLHDFYPYNSHELQPKLWNTFSRLTLVGTQYCERVTLDVDLTFYTENRVSALNGVAVAEVKMEADHRDSPFLAQMRAQKIHPQGFSKYCIGVSLLYGQVKKNSLKPKLLRLEKMMSRV